MVTVVTVVTVLTLLTVLTVVILLTVLTVVTVLTLLTVVILLVSEHQDRPDELEGTLALLLARSEVSAQQGSRLLMAGKGGIGEHPTMSLFIPVACANLLGIWQGRRH